MHGALVDEGGMGGDDGHRDRGGVVRVEGAGRGARGAVHGGVVRGGETGLCVERAQGAVDALAEGAGGLGGGEDDRAAAPLRVGVVVVGGLDDPPDAGVPVEGAVSKGAARLRVAEMPSDS